MLPIHLVAWDIDEDEKDGLAGLEAISEERYIAIVEPAVRLRPFQLKEKLLGRGTILTDKLD